MRTFEGPYLGRDAIYDETTILNLGHLFGASQVNEDDLRCDYGVSCAQRIDSWRHHHPRDIDRAAIEEQGTQARFVHALVEQGKPMYFCLKALSVTTR